MDEKYERLRTFRSVTPLPIQLCTSALVALARHEAGGTISAEAEAIFVDHIRKGLRALGGELSPQEKTDLQTLMNLVHDNLQTAHLLDFEGSSH